MRWIIFGVLGLLMMAPTAPSAQESALVIFSGRKEPLIKPVLNLFTEETGIAVTLKSGSSGALGQQILQEQPNPTADIFIGKESGSLEYLRMAGVFEPYLSENIQKIPERFRARDGSWVGVSGRSRAVIFNKDLIKEEDVPKALQDLTDAKYKGKIAATNAGNESFVAWVSALRLDLGDEKTRDILEKLKANDIHLLSDSHTDVRKAVGRGEYPLGLINHYYYHLQKHESDDALTNVGIVYLDQEEGGRGEIINVSGAAIVKNAPHPELAKRFMDFLVSSEAQALFAEVNFEYPLLPSVPSHPDVKESVDCAESSVLNCIHVMDVYLDQLGPAVEETQNMLDEINWY